MSKLPNVGTTIFTVMSQLAAKHGAINLSQGFPNFPVDPRLTQLLQEIAPENVHQYAPMTGLPALSQALVQLTDQQYHRRIDADKELLITAGATQAIFTIIQAVVKAGDEVVILDPSYDCYAPAVVLAGGKPVHVRLNDEFLPDWNRIESAFSERTALIITNNPHNPSGRIWREADFQHLETLLDRFDRVLWLSDEVYEYITFEQKHLSAHLRTRLHHRMIVTSSFGKTFHITGWKIGYLIAPEAVMNEIKKVHQFLVFCVNSVAQHTLARYLQEVHVDALGPFYQTKRDYFRSLLQGSRFELLPSEGSYFQTASYAGISDEHDQVFAQRILREHGVATIPFSAFYADQYDPKMIRFCFAKDDQTLEQAAEKLCKI